MLTKEEADIIFQTICDTCPKVEVCNRDGSVYMSVNLEHVAKALDTYVDKSFSLDKLNYSYFHERMDKAEQNIATVNNNQAVLKEATSHDFNIVYERLDKMQRHLDSMKQQINDNAEQRSKLHSQHNVWLTALEQTVMDMKGAELGRQVSMPTIRCRCPEGKHHCPGYTTNQKPQREEI